MIRSVHQGVFDEGASQTQAREIQRVRDAIGALVMEFCTAKIQKEFPATFTMNELEAHIWRHREHYTPGSAGRILRHLAARGEINYVCTNRAKSEYRLVRVEGGTLL